jgi:hypothetical protein
VRAYEEPDGGEMLGPDGEEERGLHTAHVPGVGISLLQLQRLMAKSRQSAKLFSSRRNWDSPTPHPQARMLPPFGSGWRGTLAGERGGGRVPNSDEGTSTVVLCKYMYFVVNGEV